jgi:hypothetical protein
MIVRKLPLLLLLLAVPLSFPAQGQYPPDPPVGEGIMNMGEGLSGIGPPKKPKLSRAAKAALSPPDDLKMAYRDFLRQKNTGLFRLLPPTTNKERMRISAENPTAYIPFRDGGSSYSFSKRKYDDGYSGTELHFYKNAWLCNPYRPEDAFWLTSYIGFITKLGDVALEDVTLDRKEARFLGFKAPNRKQAAEEYREMSSLGFGIDGVFYKSCVPAENNTTYLARMINFESDDLLVAFRIVREEPDGSLVILWKILKKYPVTYFKKEVILYNPFPG